MRQVALASALVLGLTAGTASIVVAQQPAQPDPDQVVATVGGEDITIADLQVIYAQLPEQFRQMPLEMLYTNLVENAIDSHLLTVAAAESGTADDPEVVERVQSFRERIMQQVYLDNVLETELSDDVLRARYDEEIGAAPEQFEVRASHILVETENEAAEIIGLLDDGGDFAALAAERSTGPSGPNGGDLGYFGAGNTHMVPEFEEAAFAMEVGDHSETPVQTQFGWHVILVTDKRAVAKPAFEEVRDQLRSDMAEQVITEALLGMREGVTIEIFNLDGSPVEDVPAEAAE